MKKRWLLLVLVALLAAPVGAQAQDEALAGAVQQVVNEGLDGGPDSVARIIEIFQAHGIAEAYQVSVDEARWVGRFEREDRDARGRVAAALNEGMLTSSQIALVGFMLVQGRKLSCSDAAQKGEAADRLARALTGITQVQIIAGGLAAATGAGVILTVPLGVGIAITGFSAYWASQLANQYKAAAAAPGVKCGSLEGQWNTPTIIRASLGRILSPIGDSWRWGSGSSRASSSSPSTMGGSFISSRYPLASGIGPSWGLRLS